MQFFKQIKRSCNFESIAVQKQIEKVIGIKKITRFCTMEDQLALLNNNYLFVYDINNGKQKYFFHLRTLTSYSKINLYHVRFIKFKRVLMLLFVLTDKIVIKYKNRLIFQLQINQPLYRYEKFYYDQYENYFIIQGKTMADNFTLMLVSKLFNKEPIQVCQTPNLLRLSLGYNSIFFNAKTLFQHLTQEYLTIDSVCILPLHKLFIYNKVEKELYLCDLQQLYQIYPTYAYLDDYEYSILKVDKTQDCLPFQAIVGAYSKINATVIKTNRNKLILIQDRDPISEVIWEEQYALEDEGNLRYITRNKRKERRGYNDE